MMKRWIAVQVLLLWSLAIGSAFAAESITCWFPPGAKNDQAQAIASGYPGEHGSRHAYQQLVMEENRLVQGEQSESRNAPDGQIQR